MINNRKTSKVSFDSFSNLDYHDRFEIHFELYLKLNEIKQIAEILEKIRTQPNKDRLRLIDENYDILSMFMGDFLEDTFAVLDGMYLDPRSMELSLDLMSSLRETMHQLHLILSDIDGQTL